MVTQRQHYTDRTEAGRHLGELLSGYAGENPVVVGLPRGGVVVAAEIARSLGCPLDVIIAGKLRAPMNPELAIGAITETGAAYINKSAVGMLGVDKRYIEDEKRLRLQTVTERLTLYRKVKDKIPLDGRTVIISDDGLATGSTMISAIQAARAEGAVKIIVAVPGGPEDTVSRITKMKEVDEVICPLVPAAFYAVSQLYLDFGQVEDTTVVEVLKEFA